MLKLRSPQTVHQEYWEHNNCALVYEYDPTDDGPECSPIRLIRASHTPQDIQIEKLEYLWRDTPHYFRMGLV